MARNRTAFAIRLAGRAAYAPVLDQKDTAALLVASRSNGIDALEAAATAGNINREVINIGSGTEASIETLVEVIGRVTNNPIIPLRNLSGGGVKRLWANIGKAQALFDFDYRDLMFTGAVNRRYAVSPDGRSFLVGERNAHRHRNDLRPDHVVQLPAKAVAVAIEVDHRGWRRCRRCSRRC